MSSRRQRRSRSSRRSRNRSTSVKRRCNWTRLRYCGSENNYRPLPAPRRWRSFRERRRCCPRLARRHGCARKREASQSWSDRRPTPGAASRWWSGDWPRFRQPDRSNRPVRRTERCRSLPRRPSGRSCSGSIGSGPPRPAQSAPGVQIVRRSAGETVSANSAGEIQRQSAATNRYKAPHPDRRRRWSREAGN
jgi:hypothetical protein